MNIKKITFMALLTTIALVIFTIEAQIPNPFYLSGIKLGLANIVTVYAMFALGPMPTLMILVSRIFLGSLLSGQVMTLLYSAAGGFLCYLSMLIMRKIVNERQIWVCSIVGSICHNIGQITVAILITRTPRLLIYLPILLVSGIVAGIFTGLCAQYIVHRLPPKQF